MGKIVYQVNASCEGTVGVFTNMKKAHDAVMRLGEGVEDLEIYTVKTVDGKHVLANKKPTYANFCKAMREKGHVSFELPSSSLENFGLEVTMFELNTER